jgi:pimeloyl-ACP methyl ester carboxylesterase
VSDGEASRGAVELSFCDVGAGEPVVILHGLFGSKRNWASIARRLGSQRRVLTVDLRNHGESPWLAVHEYAALAGDVAGLIEKVVGGPAAVIGHSMGGKAAMVLALTRPDLVDRLVAVDIPPDRSSGTPVGYVRGMQAVSLGSCTRRADVEAALAATIPDPAVRAFLATNVIVRPEGLAWAVNLDAIERQFDTILGFPDLSAAMPFRKPTLFLTGGRSDYVQPHHHAGIRRLFPAAEIAVIPEAGHWVHADAPEAFVDVVVRFLGS